MKALEKIINYNFQTYRGCTIEKDGTCFIALGEVFPTLEDAKAAIDKSFESFKNLRTV